ncbi:sensor histidine kinase, partial [Haliangium sp. UPWRP_2]|uniref:sensor histidine kinase n=1 Tax=Haliangium sp. UPWRP_2 TaxID=1931276 RepID=UPI0011B1F1DA
RTTEEPLRTLLDESRNRIQSIALIHEKLYQSERLAWIDFGDYLKDLTTRLTRAIGAQSPQTRISTQAENVFLDIERAIPCALIVNELVSNALKHAFPGGLSGEIRITACLVAPDLLELVVSDTGIGFPAELDFRNTNTLGMKLVCSLTTQLRGTVKLSRDGGTRFEIRFSVPPGKSPTLWDPDTARTG